MSYERSTPVDCSKHHLVEVLDLERGQLITTFLPALISHRDLLQLLSSDLQIIIDNNDIMSSTWINSIFQFFLGSIQSLPN